MTDAAEPESNPEFTKIAKATPKSETLTTTIPLKWARLLGIKEGDKGRWELRKDKETGKLYLMLTRQD